MSPAIPKDSIVLVTGVNGYIASHVADQLLQAGYRVRGTTRNLTKVKSLSALWEQKFGKGRFEAVIVEDMSPPGAFDEAMKEVSGVAHLASNTTFDHDPNKVIPGTISGIKGILESAAKQTSVKRFVYTSSSTAASAPIPNKEFTIDTNTWNEATVKAAWAPPPYEEDRKWAVYGASKTEGEKAVWEFVKEQKPGFVVNTILPNANFGEILVEDQVLSTTAGWIKSLYAGKIDDVRGIPPQWFVDTQDDARLHVACLVDPDVQNERIFAFAEPYNFNDCLRIMRKLRPNQTIADDFEDDSVRDKSKVANERAAELLQKNYGKGFTSLTESIKLNIQDL
ncbi:NAD-dependent epimerase deHydratase terH [Hyphodiscus hymeniophilus]|uniref:NAD-dependent epimerase deHydratase terH n=1 Tax=Hyphodiscus hymeniophilus TaxID=353542 RepID=A0A9P7AYI3_9HELO|nr:NAD-dependent epimerase deHydratase terH [Hyphodiscus hymeniophilus]